MRKFNSTRAVELVHENILANVLDIAQGMKLHAMLMSWTGANISAVCYIDMGYHGKSDDLSHNCTQVMEHNPSGHNDPHRRMSTTHGPTVKVTTHAKVLLPFLSLKDATVK
ncbi:uncharacterized protein [Procambarus clarkii]|uniref:uncharacterized protein isoform X1 n=1 Tax=Procambarus clarkii TaxID=6728 RepID=UPI001E670C99|nr:uncharacterized protein LOC123768118 isoform X2 [Procambarus clarkii]